MNSQPQAPAAFTREKKLRYHWTVSWVGPRADMGVLGGGRNPFSRRYSNPGTPSRSLVTNPPSESRTDLPHNGQFFVFSVILQIRLTKGNIAPHQCAVLQTTTCCSSTTTAWHVSQSFRTHHCAVAYQKGEPITAHHSEHNRRRGNLSWEPGTLK